MVIKTSKVYGFTKVAESVVVANKNTPSSSSAAIVGSVAAADQKTVFESGHQVCKTANSTACKTAQ